MSALIRNGRLEDADGWTFAGDAPVAQQGDVVVPLARWLAERDSLQLRTGRTGVVLEPADDPGLLAGDTGCLPLIAVRFPHFTDGRGYSTARLLRERLGYAGELRAVGDIARDQVFYLSRVGFDAFALRSGEDSQGALAALGDFSEAYQASIERPLPLFRRRAAASPAG